MYGIRAFSGGVHRTNTIVIIETRRIIANADDIVYDQLNNRIAIIENGVKSLMKKQGF